MPSNCELVKRGSDMTRQATLTLPAMSVGNLLRLRGQIDQHRAQRRKNLEQQLSELSSYITRQAMAPVKKVRQRELR
jgi:hypothetical protein